MLTSSGTRWLSALVAILVGCSGGEGTGAVPEGGWPPSIILVSLDTLRPDHTSVYGYERDTTPFLARFAEQCVVYEEAYSVAPWTLISHMTMLTGLYPLQHGVVEPRAQLSPEIPLLAEELRAVGYQTLCLYFEGWIHARHGFKRGFDYFVPHANAEEATRHQRLVFERLDPERPVFLFLHLFDTHSQRMNKRDSVLYEAPAPYETQFMPDARERLAGLNLPRMWREDEPPTPAQVEALTALYDGTIRYIDAKMEEWSAAWDESPLFQDALVIITSDHGESLGQRGKLKGHGDMWQEGLRIPLLVRAPGRAGAGTRSTARVGLTDLAPTIRQVARLAPDPSLPGYSLLAGLPEERVLVAHQPPMSAWLQGPFKVIEDEDLEAAFDLSLDPAELAPIEGWLARKAEAEAAFEAELGSRAAVRAAPGVAPRREQKTRRKLEALGYAGEEEDE